MVLLAEQERLYADELVLVNDTSTYGISAVQDWTLLKTYNLNLAKQLVVMIRADYQGYNGGNAGRIDLDDKTIWTSGGKSPSTGTYPTPDMYFLLLSGAHTVKFYGCMWTIGTGGWSQFTNIYIGQLNFNDTIGGGPWDSGSIGLATGQNTMQNQNITIPASRVLPVGSIINYSLFVFVTAKDMSGSPTRRTHMKNPGESNDSGKINIQLFINGVQVSWTSRANDDADGNTTNPSYGRGADGYYAIPVAANQTLNIQVQAYVNASATAECYLTAFLCPWITPAQDYQPVDFIFPQGSTFYAWLEPLYNNSTAFASKIGMKRFKSFGDSTDYYSVVSGTGILQHSYMLDVVDVGSATWVVSSTTIVCISYLAVDVR